jgi:hypothetical protein
LKLVYRTSLSSRRDIKAPGSMSRYAISLRNAAAKQDLHHFFAETG